MKRIGNAAGALVLQLGLLVAGSTGARGDILPILPADSAYAVVLGRDVGMIREDEQAARQMEAAAGLELSQGQVALAHEKGLVEEQKRRIDEVKQRIDEAKKAKDEAAKAEQDRVKKLLETELKRLERRRDMRVAELESAQARKEAARAWASACGLEISLGERRAEAAETREKLGATENERANAARRVLEAENAFLQSQREAYGRRGAAADKARDLCKARLELMEAQVAAATARGE